MSFADKSSSEYSKEQWNCRLEAMQVQRSTMNKLIMNYLVTEGFKEAAEKFQEESGVEPPLTLSLMDNRIRVREAIQAGRTQEAIRLVNELYPELLDNDRYLYFRLQQLHLIELIREGKDEEALDFAQTQLSEAGESEPTILIQLEKALALLAFEEPSQSPFSHLLNMKQRHKVASEVNTAILKTEFHSSTEPKMYALVKLIMWAQDELTKKKVKFPKMVDIGTAEIDSPTK
ncbi:RanBPM_CRA [Nesidiocoris tenuis]|nr:RanBPM_CRA [Nesidiocoris tenuis]